MKSRLLGNTGVEVSEVGFGAWQIGADWGTKIPKELAISSLHAAVDEGINFIDTADVYGTGRSETIIGEFLKERNETIHVATKMGRGSSEWTDGYDQIAKAAEDSCKRLGVPALDLMQLHCIPQQTLMVGKAFENLEKIKDLGLIKNYGASVETIEEALFCIRSSSASTLQVIFNIFRQRVISDLLQAASRNRVGIIARVPLASGLLSGKFTKDHNFAENDHRKFNCDGQMFNVGETFAGVPFESGVDFAIEVERILEGQLPNASLAQKSLRWILDHEEVTTVIPGAKNPEQTRQNAAVSAFNSLSMESHEKLSDLYKEKIDKQVRGRY
ncbi:aldo/keto reductase [Verrucomicrobiales bacterium]|nr:aldo/keto reductase [Verrucomicrobiales bacterium]